MTKETDNQPYWLTGRLVFFDGPDGKPYFAMEWLKYVGDEDDPRETRIILEEAEVT